MVGKTCKSLAGRDNTAEALIGVGGWVNESGSRQGEENAFKDGKISLR